MRRLAGLALVVAAAAAAASVAAQSAPTAALGSGAAGSAAAAAASAGAAPAAPALGAADGRRLYMSYCVRCHGINLVSSTSAYFDLRRFPQDEKERFVRSVSKGVRAMPAWEGTVKPEEIEAIWAYVGSVNGWGRAEAPK